MARDEPRIGPAKTIITPTAITIAVTMTGTWSAIPTAVITESSEKTMSSSRIWMITALNEAPGGTSRAWLPPSSLSWIS